MLQEIEDIMDIEDALKAKNEPGEPIAWEELKKEFDVEIQDSGQAICCKGA